MRYAMTVKLVALFLCLASNAMAQISDERAHEIARETVRSSTGADHTFFRSHRMEDLEDAYYSVRFFADGTFQRDPQIFQVSDEGYEFKKDTIEYHLSVHGPFVYFVAVSSRSGDTYRIAGFKDSQREFNRLAKSYQIRLRNELQAQEYARLYLKLDPQNYRLTQTPSLLLLKQLAERRFGEQYADFAQGDVRFEEWWNKHESALAHLSLEEKILTTDKGFMVSFLTLSGIYKTSPSPGPVPMKVTLTLSKDGQIDEPTFAQVELR
jgi:hypothetical protein